MWNPDHPLRLTSRHVRVEVRVPGSDPGWMRTSARVIVLRLDGYGRVTRQGVLQTPEGGIDRTGDWLIQDQAQTQDGAIRLRREADTVICPIDTSLLQPDERVLICLLVGVQKRITLGEIRDVHLSVFDGGALRGTIFSYSPGSPDTIRLLVSLRCTNPTAQTRASWRVHIEEETMPGQIPALGARFGVGVG